MSEKRFTYYYERGNEVVIEENGKRISTKKVVEKLNEQQDIIEEKNKVIRLMGAFIKSKGFSVNDFDEWISKDWHNVDD